MITLDACNFKISFNGLKKKKKLQNQDMCLGRELTRSKQISTQFSFRNQLLCTVPGSHHYFFLGGGSRRDRGDKREMLPTFVSACPWKRLTDLTMKTMLRPLLLSVVFYAVLGRGEDCTCSVSDRRYPLCGHVNKSSRV